MIFLTKQLTEILQLLSSTDMAVGQKEVAIWFQANQTSASNTIPAHNVSLRALLCGTANIVLTSLTPTSILILLPFVCFCSG